MEGIEPVYQGCFWVLKIATGSRGQDSWGTKDCILDGVNSTYLGDDLVGEERHSSS